MATVEGAGISLAGGIASALSHEVKILEAALDEALLHELNDGDVVSFLSDVPARESSDEEERGGAPGRARWPLVLLLAALVVDFYVTRRA